MGLSRRSNKHCLCDVACLGSSLLARSTSTLMLLYFSNKGVESWCFGHYVLICFANLFRGRSFLGTLSRGATESDPENQKTRKNCIRYGDCWESPPYLLRRQDHPPAPHPSSFPWQLARPPSAVSLSLSFSLTISSGERRTFLHRGQFVSHISLFLKNAVPLIRKDSCLPG